MKPIIFARISDMKFYKGVTDNDMPKNGGSWVKENNYAHECCNFLPIGLDDGSKVCLGYVQLIGGATDAEPQIHIEKIYDCKSSRKDSEIEGVTVVFVSTNTTNMRVVGFYKNATVLRYSDVCIINEGDPDEYEQFYYFYADCSDCVLIPFEDRFKTSDWYVPMSGKHGNKYGFGHSNIWFAGSNTDNPKEIEYVENMINRIENYKGENWINKYD